MLPYNTDTSLGITFSVYKHFFMYLHLTDIFFCIDRMFIIERGS